MDPVVIRRACDAYARKFIDIQRVQFKRLGVLGDWENPYLTLNKQYEADELRLFADIVQKKFVYRGKKPVYWSIPCRTALAEAEVEYKDHVSQSVYVKFPVVGHDKTFVVIWTTTPWTLPANLAVAYNREFQYVRVEVGGEKYILFRGLLPGVAEKCGWANYKEVPVGVDDLAKLEYQHPFCNRTGKLFAADFVTKETGTGFVHIAPGHGLDDYNLGLKVGLPIYSPVDDDGKLAYTNDLPREQQMPESMIGKALLEKHGKSDANEAVLHELRLRHALLHQENYHHSYPHCWRSKTPIVFRAMDQWFIKIDHAVAGNGIFREGALAEIGRVTWIPDWGVNRIKGAVQSRPDWCISRQRTWGVPLPAFYDAKGNAILDAQVVRNVADLIEQHGSNVWFEKTAAELWALVKPKNWSGTDAVAKSQRYAGRLDRFGQLIARGHRPTQGNFRERKTFRGRHVFGRFSDQHRGWFQSSLLLSLAGNGAAPFKTVLTHGFMVDADREKISKSKQGQGGYEKPQTAEAYVKKWGADVVRLWVASQDFRNDIVVSEERISKVAETYRAIRNALRYQLSNLYDFIPAVHTVSDDKLTGLDRWILNEFSKLQREVTEAFDKYEFHVVYQNVSQFVAVELSAVYHDVIKDRLYTDPAGSHRRRSTQTMLLRLFTGLCQMLSPILSFTADEAWEFVPGKPAGSVHESSLKPENFSAPKSEEADWKSLFELRNAILPELEKSRQARTIGKSLESKVIVFVAPNTNAEVAEKFPEDFRELLNVSQLKFERGGVSPVCAVERAGGEKCERCWRWELDVGRNPAHPTICGRCVEAIDEKR